MGLMLLPATSTLTPAPATVSQGFIELFDNWLGWFRRLALGMRLVLAAEDRETFLRYQGCADLELFAGNFQVIRALASMRTIWMRVFRWEMHVNVCPMHASRAVWLKSPEAADPCRLLPVKIRVQVPLCSTLSGGPAANPQDQNASLDYDNREYRDLVSNRCP